MGDRMSLSLSEILEGYDTGERVANRSQQLLDDAKSNLAEDPNFARTLSAELLCLLTAHVAKLEIQNEALIAYLTQRELNA